MKLSRTLVIVMVLSVGMLCVSTLSSAQEKYPAREIEYVIPWSPGGVSDIVGRIFANELSKNLNVPVTPVNKAGGSATIGGTYVYRAKKDGYTVLNGSLGWLVGSLLLNDIPFDCLRDFVPIMRFAATPQAIFVKQDSPFKTIDDLIEKAKKNPKMISCGTGGTASDSNFALQIFQKAAGIEFNIVPFKGGGESPPAVLGGHVDIAISVLSVVVNFVKAGNMRVLVISGDHRLKEFPDTPTFKEKGFTQTYMDNWNGLVVPAGVPQNVITTLTAASEKAVKSKELITAVERTASVVDSASGEAFRKRIENDRNMIEAIASELKLKAAK